LAVRFPFGPELSYPGATGGLMTLRRDTLRDRWTAPTPDRAKSAETTDPGPPPVLDRPEVPDAAAGAEPIDVIFRKIAQREQIVPKSVEPGVSYQAVHTPAPSRAALLESPVVLNITTDPATRVEMPEEAAGVPGRSRRPAVLALAVLAVLLLVGLGVLLLRPATSTTGSAGTAAPSVRPSPAVVVPPPPALSALPPLPVPSAPAPALAPSVTSAVPQVRPAPQRPAAPAPTARKSEISDDPAGL
jgi:hypothetical protein